MAPKNPPTGSPISPEQGRELLALARSTLAAYLASGKMPDRPRQTTEPEWAGGIFVTLRDGDALRGCIGWIRADAPLPRMVMRCAISSATEDPRFAPVSPDELSRISIEISILSPPVPVGAPEDIQVGRDGLIVESAGRRGLLLPQVATQERWDRERFLREVCAKAGLGPDDWRSGASLQRFTAQVFVE